MTIQIPGASVEIEASQEHAEILRTLFISQEFQAVKISREIVENKFSGMGGGALLSTLISCGALIEEKNNDWQESVCEHRFLELPNNSFPDLTDEEAADLLVKTNHGRSPYIADQGTLEWIKHRKSTKRFADEKLSEDEVKSMLRFSYGNIGFDLHGYVHKAVPSAGCLYPLKIVFSSVSKNRSYIFDGADLHPNARDVSTNDLLEACMFQKMRHIIDCAHATGFFHIFADLKFACAKYGNRGYLFSVLEAGHVAQNMYVFCALKHDRYGICELGSLKDKPLRTLVGNDPSLVHVVSLVVGVPHV